MEEPVITADAELSKYNFSLELINMVNKMEMMEMIMRDSDELNKKWYSERHWSTILYPYVIWDSTKGYIPNPSFYKNPDWPTPSDF